MTTGAEDERLLTDGQELCGERYEILNYLASGGMQQVYVAQDRTLNRRVALKAPKKRAGRRFQRSAKLSAMVNHPNVAKTLDYFTEAEDSFYLVEELVEGLDLAKLLKACGALDPYAVAYVLHHLAKGVAASHRVHVVHRDLKPNNVMVSGGLRLNEVKVTDFGIAVMTEREFEEAVNPGASIDITTAAKSTTLAGALPYLAPEVIANPRNAKEPADVWAIAAICYHLLSGRRPFGEFKPDESPMLAVPNILQAKFDPLPEWCTANPQWSELVGNLLEIISRCFKLRQEERPTALELAELASNLCYRSIEREQGVFTRFYVNPRNGYVNRSAGTITSESGEDVWYHADSLYCPAKTIPEGTPVWYSKYFGQPYWRACPVVPLASS